MALEGRLRVGIIFGGRSGEHEISIRSARSVVAAIDRSRFDVTIIGIDRSGRWHLHREDAFHRLGKAVAGGDATEVLLAPRGGGYALIDMAAPQQTLPTVDVVFPV